MKHATFALLLLTLLTFSLSAQVPNGVSKLSSPTLEYEGEVDGLVNDIQNSYTWAAEFFGGLYLPFHAA